MEEGEFSESRETLEALIKDFEEISSNVNDVQDKD